MALEATQSTAAVVSPSVIAAGSGGSLSVELACPAASACSGWVSLSTLRTTSQARRAARIAVAATRTKPVTVKTGHVDAVRFGLTRQERTSLRRRHRASAVLTLRERSRTRRYTIVIKTKPAR